MTSLWETKFRRCHSVWTRCWHFHRERERERERDGENVKLEQIAVVDPVTCMSCILLFILHSKLATKLWVWFWIIVFIIINCEFNPSILLQQKKNYIILSEGFSKEPRSLKVKSFNGKNRIFKVFNTLNVLKKNKRVYFYFLNWCR